MNPIGRAWGWAVRKAISPALAGLSPVYDSRGGWNPLIMEPYAGAWQNNDPLTVDIQLAYSAVYACVNLRANDMAKMRHKLVERVGGIGKNWRETTSPSFSPFLRKPNRLQNHIQFKQWWAMCKLLHGNTYALKERDSRGVVIHEYILDPCRVKVLVTPDGSAYYELRTDNLAGIQEASILVPASEIAHDRMNCLFHPLVGVSPLYAAGLAAAQGLAIQRSSRTFFGNGARPSGILTAPTRIDQPTADRLLETWNNKFSGSNSGKIAVLGDGLKFEQMTMNSTDAQLIEQLKWSAMDICTAFQVPPWKIGIGTQPTYQNGELLNLNYYSDCLQIQIEEYELCQDEALGIGEGVTVEGRELGVELDLKGLLRMDTQTAHTIAREDVRGSLITINEARTEVFDLPPVDGGDVIWMQQQNFSLDALVARDQSDDPFGTNTPAPAPAVAPQDNAPAANDAQAASLEATRKALEETAERIAGIEEGLAKLADVPPVDVPAIVKETIDALQPAENNEDKEVEDFVKALQLQFAQADPGMAIEE